MAIAFVGSVSANTTNGTLSLVTPTHTVGDVMVLVVKAGTTQPTPTGFTLFNSRVSTLYSTQKLWLFYKYATTTTETITCNGYAGVCQIYSGVRTGTPFGEYTSRVATAATSTLYIDGITEGYSNSWILGFTAGYHTANKVYTVGPGLTSRTDAEHTTYAYTELVGADTNGVASNPFAQTYYTVDAAINDYISMTVELVASGASQLPITLSSTLSTIQNRYPVNIGSEIIKFVGQANAPGGSGSISITTPAHEIGDFMILAVESLNTQPTPSGFTLIASKQSTAYTTHFLYIFYKVATSTTEVISCAGYTGVVQIYSGVRTVNPYVINGGNTGSGTGLYLPSFEPFWQNSWAVSFAGAWTSADGTITEQNTNMTLRSDCPWSSYSSRELVGSDSNGIITPDLAPDYIKFLPSRYDVGGSVTVYDYLTYVIELVPQGANKRPVKVVNTINQTQNTVYYNASYNTGYISPTIVESKVLWNTGGTGWTNPDNAKIIDATYTSTNLSNHWSEDLVARGYNLYIPPTADITDLAIQATFGTTGTVNNYSQIGFTLDQTGTLQSYMFKNISGQSMSTTTYSDSASQYDDAWFGVYDNSNSTSRNWVPSDFNSPYFGTVVYFNTTSTLTIDVDAFALYVAYDVYDGPLLIETHGNRNFVQVTYDPKLITSIQSSKLSIAQTLLTPLINEKLQITKLSQTQTLLAPNLIVTSGAARLDFTQNNYVPLVNYVATTNKITQTQTLISPTIVESTVIFVSKLSQTQNLQSPDILFLAATTIFPEKLLFTSNNLSPFIKSTVKLDNVVTYTQAKYAPNYVVTIKSDDRLDIVQTRENPTIVTTINVTNTVLQIESLYSTNVISKVNSSIYEYVGTNNDPRIFTTLFVNKIDYSQSMYEVFGLRNVYMEMDTFFFNQEGYVPELLKQKVILAETGLLSQTTQNPIIWVSTINSISKLSQNLISIVPNINFVFNDINILNVAQTGKDSFINQQVIVPVSLINESQTVYNPQAISYVMPDLLYFNKSAQDITIKHTVFVDIITQNQNMFDSSIWFHPRINIEQEYFTQTYNNPTIIMHDTMFMWDMHLYQNNTNIIRVLKQSVQHIDTLVFNQDNLYPYVQGHYVVKQDLQTYIMSGKNTFVSESIHINELEFASYLKDVNLINTIIVNKLDISQNIFELTPNAVQLTNNINVTPIITNHLINYTFKSNTIESSQTLFDVNGSSIIVMNVTEINQTEHQITIDNEVWVIDVKWYETTRTGTGQYTQIIHNDRQLFYARQAHYCSTAETKTIMCVVPSPIIINGDIYK